MSYRQPREQPDLLIVISRNDELGMNYLSWNLLASTVAGNQGSTINIFNMNRARGSSMASAVQIPVANQRQKLEVCKCALCMRLRDHSRAAN